jgi:hypothetical protein
MTHDLMKHNLMRRTMVLFLGLSLVMIMDYAGAQNSPDVTGTWVGDTVRGSSKMTMVLKQTGNRVAGTIVGVGTDDGNVDGNVDGNTIRLRFDNGTDETPALSIKGNEITGMLSGAAIRFRRIAASS